MKYQVRKITVTQEYWAAFPEDYEFSVDDIPGFSTFMELERVAKRSEWDISVGNPEIEECSDDTTLNLDFDEAGDPKTAIASQEAKA